MPKRPATKPSVQVALLPSLSTQIGLGLLSISLIVAGIFASNQSIPFTYHSTAACDTGDCDNDGLSNEIDWDDDGDGIADVAEGICTVSNFSLDFQALDRSKDPVSDINKTQLALGSAILSLSAIGAKGMAKLGDFEISDEHITGTFGPKIGVLSSSSIDDHVRIHFEFTSSVHQLEFDIHDIDQRDAIQVNASLGKNRYTLSISEYTTPACVSYIGNNVFESICNTAVDGTTDGSIHLNFADAVDEVEILLYQSSGPDEGSISFGSFTAICKNRDTDQDGLADFQDRDSDNDGLSDDTENHCTDKAMTGDLADNDGDGYPNFIDLDADNDGIPDLVESGGADRNGDGRIDALNKDASLQNDLDGDGLDDHFDTVDSYAGGSLAWSSGIALTEADMDQDGIPNYFDLDSDADGIPDIIEAGGIDTDGNGLVDAITDQGLLIDDRDHDGFDDRYDTDDNGILGIDQTYGALMLPVDHNMDGFADEFPAYQRGINPATSRQGGDADGDNHPNFLDLDADNDGIPDVVEIGGQDANGDGYIDIFPATPLIYTLYNLGTDPSALADKMDKDKLPDHRNVDFDQDGIPNYLDLDADNDGISDVVETWTEHVDLDQNGIVDGQFANDLNHDGWHDAYWRQIPTTLDSSNTEFPNNDIPDFQTGDGKADYDGDGLPNFLDIDADNDGIVDLIEAQSSSIDTADIFGGLQMSSATDMDYNGLSQAFDVGELGSYILPYNHDQTDNPDFLDADADNDGVIDILEGHDGDCDGTVEHQASGFDIDADGLDDAFDADLTSPKSIRSNQSIQDSDEDLSIGGDRDWRDANTTTFSVQWVSFAASLKGEDGTLQWATVSEIDIDHYSVERSVDSKAFEVLGQIDALSQSNERSDYAFTDLGVLKSGYSKVYYRLKQIRKDGASIESPIIELSLDGLAQLFEIEAYPSAADQQISFHYLQAHVGNIQIAVLNTHGQLVWRRKLNDAFTKGEIKLNISNWASGTYLVQMSNETTSSNFKWIKK